MSQIRDINEVGEFLASYAAHMMGSGVHTSRIVRCTKRIGSSLGYKVRMNVFQKSLVIYVVNLENIDDHFTRVIDIPSQPISFEHNSELSALSWKAYDEHLSLDEIKNEYQAIVSTYSVKPTAILFLASIANAAFCAIFGGDKWAILIVFIATLVGFFIRQKLMALKMNHYLVFIICAFVASLIASSAMNFSTTKDTAVATSVLFLIPGVPLINGVIDLLEGYGLSGMSRLIQAFLLIFCLALGMSFTLIIFKNGLL